MRLRDAWDTLLLWILPQWWYRRLNDRCERCKGMHGGVRGNENVGYINGRRMIVCDYCHYALRMLWDRD